MHEESSAHYARYFSYLNLFVFSMLLLVLGANYVIMFIGWEGVGLCSYLLIGYWFRNVSYTNAAKKAFVMNRIGDLGFLLAVFWMINEFGSVTFSEVFAKAPGSSVSIITGITILLFIGATGKSAQIPLYTWLPDAMAGPTPVSALIHAATMVTAGIYMIARSNFLYSLAPISREIIAITGLATALIAASIALYQNDIKKVLAYSTVSQLGFMFLALGVGAYTTGVFHVMTHAFFKALLFLGAGSVIHAMSGEQDITRMGGLYRKIPVTAITFIMGVLAISGFPFTSGFVSKDEILAAVYQHNKIYFWLAVLGALLTALYMFRLMMLTFFGSFRGTPDQWHHVHESPAAMTFPLLVLAFLSLAGGWIQLPHVFGGHPYFNEFLATVVRNAPMAEEDLSTLEYMLLGGTVLLLAIIYFLTRKKYAVGEYAPDFSGYKKWPANKWFVDEFYDFLIVRPLQWLNKNVIAFVEREVIDWIVNGVGKAVQLGSRQARLLQSGQVGSYVLLMVLGMLVFFAIELLVLRK
jgi:NADH-quinone oxidoreductase subunit L